VLNSRIPMTQNNSNSNGLAYYNASPDLAIESFIVIFHGQY